MSNSIFKLFSSIIFVSFIVSGIEAQVTWTEQFMPNLNGTYISDITFTDVSTGYAVTGTGQVGYTNYILKTTNGGDTWNIILSLFREFSRISFINSNTGFVTGGLNQTTPLIMKTTNGGANWFDLSQPTGNAFINDIFVVNENLIWITSWGTIIRSTDGGNSWQYQYYHYLLNHVYMFNQNSGFGGSNINLFKTSNSGNNWILSNGATFTDIFFVDSLTGWKANDYMYKTSDGGNTWTYLNIPFGLSLFRFSVISRDIIWGTGGQLYFGNNVRGVVFNTTDGGNNWGYQLPDTSFEIERYNFIKFININTGWAYGSTKGIHTKNGGIITGIQQKGSEIPKNYTLHQNYPNPFNPTTKISYDLPSTITVNLVVYDLLGREVKTLVNEKQNAGRHEIEFDASNYPSGVYYYKLSTDNFSQTKKMVLIK